MVIGLCRKLYAAYFTGLRVLTGSSCAGGVGGELCNRLGLVALAFGTGVGHNACFLTGCRLGYSACVPCVSAICRGGLIVGILCAANRAGAALIAVVIGLCRKLYAAYGTGLRVLTGSSRAGSVGGELCNSLGLGFGALGTGVGHNACVLTGSRGGNLAAVPYVLAGLGGLFDNGKGAVEAYSRSFALRVGDSRGKNVILCDSVLIGKIHGPKTCLGAGFNGNSGNVYGPYNVICNVVNCHLCHQVVVSRGSRFFVGIFLFKISFCCVKACGVGRFFAAQNAADYAAYFVADRAKVAAGKRAETENGNENERDDLFHFFFSLFLVI